jgi:hypothetical protein
MAEDEQNLEEIIRRPARRDGDPSRPINASATLGQCDCGARISPNDLYGERGGADLGGPRRLAVRLVQYCCPLCGHVGELLVDG